MPFGDDSVASSSYSFSTSPSVQCTTSNSDQEKIIGAGTKPYFMFLPCVRNKVSDDPVLKNTSQVLNFQRLRPDSTIVDLRMQNVTTKEEGRWWGLAFEDATAYHATVKIRIDDVLTAHAQDKLNRGHLFPTAKSTLHTDGQFYYHPMQCTLKIKLKTGEEVLETHSLKYVTNQVRMPSPNAEGRAPKRKRQRTEAMIVALPKDVDANADVNLPAEAALVLPTSPTDTSNTSMSLSAMGTFPLIIPGTLSPQLAEQAFELSPPWPANGLFTPEEKQALLNEFAQVVRPRYATPIRSLLGIEFSPNLKPEQRVQLWVHEVVSRASNNPQRAELLNALHLWDSFYRDLADKGFCDGKPIKIREQGIHSKHVYSWLLCSYTLHVVNLYLWMKATPSNDDGPHALGKARMELYRYYLDKTRFKVSTKGDVHGFHEEEIDEDLLRLIAREAEFHAQVGKRRHLEELRQKELRVLQEIEQSRLVQ